MCQDEKDELEKQVKHLTIRANKADELKLKNDNLADIFK